MDAKVYHTEPDIKKENRQWYARFCISDVKDGLYSPVLLKAKSRKGLMRKISDYLGSNAVLVPDATCVHDYVSDKIFEELLDDFNIDDILDDEIY